MKDKFIDNLYSSRMENVDSKISVDEEMMWKKVNASLSPKEEKNIFKKTSLFIGFAGIILSVAAAISVHLYNNSKYNKAEQNSVQKVQNSTLIKSQNKKIETIVKPTESTPEIVTSIPSSGKVKNDEMKPQNISKDIKIEEKNTIPADFIPNTTKEEDNSEMNVEPSLIEPTKTNTVVKKITVVKKQVIKKDSVVNVKRVRMH
jgi:hypothetical protein